MTNRIIGLACLAVFAQPVFAEEAGEFDGYSYFMVGAEVVNYVEHHGIANSDATVTNVAVMTGGLNRVNDQYDFGFDTVSTLLPMQISETWKASQYWVDKYGPAYDATITANSARLTELNAELTTLQAMSASAERDRMIAAKQDEIAAYTASVAALQDERNRMAAGATLQTNNLKINISRLRGLVHYKVDPHWRVVGGGTFSYSAFQRYGESTRFPQGVQFSAGLKEEDIATLYLNGGLAYESSGVSRSDSHFSAKALIGLPLWQSAVNTGYPNQKFTKAKGYELALEAAYMRTLLNGVELGGYAGYTLTQRGEESLRMADGRTLTLPEGKTQALRIGGMLIWKLR